jgi:hypothetical protein
LRWQEENLLARMTDRRESMPHFSDQFLKARTQHSDCRRQGGRLLQEALRCSLGDVIDVSATGMRILTNRKRRGKVTIHLEGRFGQMAVAAEVIWSRRLGFRRHQVGLRFLNLDRKQARQLRDLMFCHRQIMPEAA